MVPVSGHVSMIHVLMIQSCPDACPNADPNGCGRWFRPWASSSASLDMDHFSKPQTSISASKFRHRRRQLLLLLLLLFPPLQTSFLASFSLSSSSSSFSCSSFSLSFPLLDRRPVQLVFDSSNNFVDDDRLRPPPSTASATAAISTTKTTTKTTATISTAFLFPQQQYRQLK